MATDPSAFLALDLEQQADLLLAWLADCPEGERGCNFIGNRGTPARRPPSVHGATKTACRGGARLRAIAASYSRDTVLLCSAVARRVPRTAGAPRWRGASIEEPR